MVGTAFLTWIGSFWIIRRGDVTHEIQDIVQDIQELESIAIAYWDSDPDMPQVDVMERRIKILNKRIGHDIYELHNSSWMFKFKDGVKLTEFRKAVSSSPFEESGRRPTKDRRDMISDTANQLSAAVKKSMKVF